MLPDRVSNPGPLTYESGALPIALRGPAINNLRGQYEKSLIGISLLCTDARRPVLRSWIRSAEVRGERRYDNGNAAITN